jgi:hypothetical protein
MVVTVVAIGAVILTPAVAMACRITNATPWSDPATSPIGQAQTLLVWFSCGSSCGAYYKIEPGKYVNTTRGQDGYVQACVPGAEGNNHGKEDGHAYISGHGEGRVKFPPGYGQPDFDLFHWDVYDSDNNVTNSVDHGMKYVGSGFDHVCWMGPP